MSSLICLLVGAETHLGYVTVFGPEERRAGEANQRSSCCEGGSPGGHDALCACLLTLALSRFEMLNASALQILLEHGCDDEGL